MIAKHTSQIWQACLACITGMQTTERGLTNGEMGSWLDASTIERGIQKSNTVFRLSSCNSIAEVWIEKHAKV